MKIRPKILILLGGMSAVLVASLYALSFGLVKGNLLELEAQNARYRLAQVVSEFDGAARYLEAANRDWGSWDETYNFLEKPAESRYLRDNINDNVFKYLRLNIFAFYGRDGRIVHFSFYGPDTATRNREARTYASALADLSLIPVERLSANSPAPISGFVAIEGTPVLISIQPVLHNDFSGPSPGWLLVGQIFDQEVVSRTGGRGNFLLNFRPATEQEKKGPEFAVMARERDRLTARLLVPGLSGAPALALESRGQRAIFSTGWKAVTSYAVLIAAITVGFAALVMFFLEKLVLSRLQSLSGGIDGIIGGRNFSQRLTVRNHDEFGSLAQNINHLLSTLESLQAEKRQRQLIDIVENVLNGCLVFFENRLIHLNAEQARINGQLPLGQNFQNYLALYVHPYDRELLTAIYRAAEAGRSEPVAPLRLFKFAPNYQDEPEQKWVQVSAHALDYRNGQAILLNMADVTKLKLLEQLVLSREKMASLGFVAAGIAHEIRNPLMGISLTLENIRQSFDAESEPELAALLTQAGEAAQAIARVLERVLDFSRPSQLHLKPLDVRAPIAAAIRLVAPFAKKNQTAIETNWPEELPEVQADHQFLMELLVNLLTNAVQAMTGQSRERRVMVAVAAGETGLGIRVMDSGPGIPRREAAKIFEPFYTTKGDGSGLGLSICRRIITDHGGTIELTYSSLSGAGFLISLPLAVNEEREHA